MTAPAQHDTTQGADDDAELDPDEAYERRMHVRHGLAPVDDYAPHLRAFAGQHDAPYARPDWFDHPRLWLDERGVEVLTVEPYAHVRDPEQAAAIVRDIAGLPLLVDGPHPGLRIADEPAASVLILFRRDPAAPPMRSYQAVTEDVAELVARMVLAEQAAGRQLAATLEAPTTHSLRGLVARVLASPETFDWAAARLAAHVLVGHLEADAAHDVMRGIARQLGRPETHAGRTLNAGYTDVCRRALLAAQVEVRGLLGPDWAARAHAVRHHPGVDRIRGFRLMQTWLTDIETAETYG
jgi:hypothetical protein